MPRIPLLAGARLQIVNAGEGAIVLTPPSPPAEALVDVGAAVRDALRFPLAGEPLEALVRRGGRATIVVELPALPLPGAALDPRQAALEATIGELVRLGVPMGRQTIVVAGGLQRRAGRRALEELVSPHFALGFSGRIEVHDIEDPELLPIASEGELPLRVNRALAEADVVVVVSAAETVLHGGPSALLAAGGSEALRAAEARSLLEPTGAKGWELAVALERALARRVPLIGVSLALNHPRVGGALRGYPFELEAVERVARSPLGRAFRLLPSAVRARMLRSLPLELTAAGVYAGPPSVAHTEALLRAVETRSTFLSEPLDAICIGISPTAPYIPRERPNALLAAYLGLGLALRLWRDRFPVVEGGTAILLHRFHRRYTHPTQQPYRAFFAAMRGRRDPYALREAERAAASGERGIAEYRAGRTCHPLLPFADWAGCLPALDRLGAVVIAGCRDGVAARQLGFVPAQGIGTALTMAEGRAGRPLRIGYLVAPPYFPLRVGEPNV